MGWAVSTRLCRHFKLMVLNLAVAPRRHAGGLLHISGRGNAYGSADDLARLLTLNMWRSMSRRGYC